MFKKRLFVFGCCLLAILGLLSVSSLGNSTQEVSAASNFAWPDNFILPVEQNVDFNITQGPRCSGTTPQQVELSHHSTSRNKEAIDIDMNQRPVIAPYSGTVYIDSVTNGEMHINHDDSNLRSVFAHMKTFNYSNGQHVDQGVVVGISGDKGTPSKPHLHFSVVSVNPTTGAETAVPIYNMPGLSWNDQVDNYPAPEGHCPTNGVNDGTVLYPPKPEGSTHNVGHGAGDNQRLFIDAFHRYNLTNAVPAGDASPNNLLGRVEGETHNAGETVGGVNYTLRLQDFVKNGDWNVIIHDEVSGANSAYVLAGNIRDEYFALHNWWMTLGAPISDHFIAATSQQGTGGLVQNFESGQIYSSNKGTFATYGAIHTFYYNYEGGGTHSSLGFPISSGYSLATSTYQLFEGGTVICENGGSCSRTYDIVCFEDASGFNQQSYVFAKTNRSLLDVLSGVSVASAQSGCENDTAPPTLGSTLLPGTAVNSIIPKIQVYDFGSGVSWVNLRIRPAGGSYSTISMSLNSGWWQASYNTLGYNNGQILEYYFQAGDNEGNSGQISGIYQIPVQNDQEKPTVSVIDLPPVIDNTLSVNMLVQDANTVTVVQMYVRPQGGNYTQVQLANTGGGWVAVYDTSGYNTGQILDYYFWAEDEYGNSGQVSGVYHTTVQDLNLGRGTVTLTFDDGLESVYTKARPILDQYEFPGVAYISTGLVGNSGTVTWSEIQTLQNTYGWEIGAHSVTHAELPILSEANMISEVANSKQALVDHNIDVSTFATPFGAYDSPTVREIAKRYDGQRGFWDRIHLNVLPYDRYWLHVKSVEADISILQVMNWIDRAQIRGEWLILVFHDIQDTPDPDDPYVTSTADLQAIVQYLDEQEASVRTVQQVLNDVESTQVNLFPNNQFQNGIGGGWWTDQGGQVTANSGTNGAYPEAQHSIKFVGGESAAHLFSSQIPVINTQSYLLQLFANTESFVSGEFGFYVDEYDANGNWISGQWQGMANLNRVRQYGFIYRPSSASVAKMNWQFYLTAGASGTIFIDNAHMSILDNTVLNSSFEELENGWALNWTGDTDYLIIDTQGQGSHGNNSVIFPSNPPSTKYLFSGQIPVDSTETYFWTSYVKATSSGDEFGFYIDEYDASGTWISGQWLGKITGNYDNWKQLVYTPTNSSVDTIRLQYYLLASSALTVTLDQVSLTTQGDLLPPTGSIVNPPSTIDEALALQVQASDDYAGVAWVEVVFYLDGEYYDDMYLIYNSSNGYWETDYPTDYIDDGSVLGYEIWIADGYGNEFHIDQITSLIQH